MRAQLRLLEELQRVDARILEMEGMLRALPERLTSMRGDLSRVEALLQGEEKELEETERWRKQQEESLRAEEMAIQKARSKLQQLRTGKEFFANQREVESARKVASDREEEVLKLIEAVEQSRKRLEQHRGEVEKVRAHVEGEAQEIERQTVALKGELAQARAEREQMATRVKPDVLRRYGTIRMRRGLAVVAVSNGTCLGCHMNIPPQLYNQLQRADAILTCPQCHRIIYWDQLMVEEDPGEGSEESSDGDGGEGGVEQAGC